MEWPLADWARYVADSLARLQATRAVADDVANSDIVHRLAMRAVFVMEDCHETFVRLRDGSFVVSGSNQTQRSDQS